MQGEKERSQRAQRCSPGGHGGDARRRQALEVEQEWCTVVRGDYARQSDPRQAARAPGKETQDEADREIERQTEATINGH